MTGHRLTPHTIDSVPALRALLGEPAESLRLKIADHVNDVTRRFIEHAPFLCLATSDAEGNCDVTPRGDPRGFVRILDARTPLLPERPGNKLADALSNILANPHVGLLFFIPGVGDTFRVNGRATLTTDRELLEPSAVEGKVPKLGILVDIDEAFTQCPKAFIRSQLWNPEHFMQRDALPTGGEVLRSLQGDDFDAEGYDAERAERYARRQGFY